jgi:hypothetical protein
MFPAPELVGAEMDYRRERAVPVRPKRRAVRAARSREPLSRRLWTHAPRPAA